MTTLHFKLTTQLQALGAKRLTSASHPELLRWEGLWETWTSLSKNPSLFIFLSPSGAMRVGQSPIFSKRSPELREKLLSRWEATSKPLPKRPKPVLTWEDMGL